MNDVLIVAVRYDPGLARRPPPAYSGGTTHRGAARKGLIMTTDAVPGLKLGDFETRIGESFTIEAETGTQALELVVAESLPQSSRAQGGFRLEFAGPAEPRLPQAIYRFTLGGAAHEIFIVAVGYGPQGGLRYEAIFL